MTDEHRLTFDLFSVPGLETRALNSIKEKKAISKRSHEYVRRIMVLGLLFTKILDKAERNILEVQCAVAADCTGVKPVDFKFRLNVELNSHGSTKTREEEIWESVSKLRKRDERKKYFRYLFLHGYWFESLAERDSDTISQLFAKENVSGNGTVADLPSPRVNNSAKSKLGDLMPL